MEQVIYKYVLPEINGVTQLEMPTDAQIVSVGSQGKQLVMWAVVNDPDNAPKRVRTFQSIFTGERYEIGRNVFVGTASFKHDNDIFPFIVCHVFELLR